MRPFGYDGQGCDVFDAVIWGARPSITIGLLTTLGVTMIGVLLGSLAGFYGGWVDALLSRLTDVMFGFPFLVGAIVILTAFPSRNAYTISFVLIVFGWAGHHPDHAVVGVRGEEHGLRPSRPSARRHPTARIIFRHILPNAITPVLVIATVGVGGDHRRRGRRSRSSASACRRPTNSWGLSISQSRGRFIESPHLLLFPSLFLSRDRARLHRPRRCRPRRLRPEATVSR